MVRRLTATRRFEPSAARFAHRADPSRRGTLGIRAARADAPQGYVQPLQLGRYEIVAKIADGGMATVFVGRVVDGADPTELVAIKTIRDEFAGNAEFLTMFMDEARIVSRLRHPNIVRSRELGNEGGHVFLVMELLLGQSLWAVWEAFRARGGRIDYETIAWIGARVAEGLHYTHELDDDDGVRLELVHRDVNATNIFVTYDGQIKIIDFGLAKAKNRASKTAAGIIKGKVAYMSPEQVVGAHVDARTDIFALGATLWELGCDRRLFKHADEAETLRRVHAAEVPDPRRLVDGFPSQLWRVIERALARDRSGRYATANELARDLDAFVRSMGGRVDERAVGRMMRDLFTEEFERLKSRGAEAQSAQVFEEVDVTYSTPNVAAGDVRTEGSIGRPGSSSRGAAFRIAFAAAVIIAFVVASLLSLR